MRNNLPALLIILTLITVSACKGAPAPDNDNDKPTVTTKSTAYNPTDAELLAAQSIVMALANGARSYFTSEQKYHATEEPWHTPADPAQAGMPTLWAEYSFPGGPGFVMSSHSAIPKGEPAMSDPVEPNSLTQTTLNKLNVTWPKHPTRFRYSYTVGPDRSDAATVTIIASARFDTSNNAIYTMTVRVDLDKNTQEVIIHPLETAMTP